MDQLLLRVFGKGLRGEDTAQLTKPRTPPAPQLDRNGEIHGVARMLLKNQKNAAETQSIGEVISMGQRKEAAKHSRPLFFAEAPSSQAIQAIERRHAIGLGHGRVVEGGIGKVAHVVALPALGHDSLADVHDLGGPIPKAVRAT